MKNSKVINLISNPRNISTAMMYSFAQRSDTKVIDEPFYGYYLNLTDVLHPGKEEILATMPLSLPSIFDQIQETSMKSEIVFLKNMAHHLIQMEWDFMLGYENILFIRHPKLIITSFAKVYENPTMTDIGLAQQYKIFEYLKNKQQNLPIVLDSGELLKNPAKMLAKLCETLKITFEGKMLHWEVGAIPEDGIWAKYWYKNVHQSTGFITQKTDEEELPSHCQALLQESLPYYEFLFDLALKCN